MPDDDPISDEEVRAFADKQLAQIESALTKPDMSRYVDVDPALVIETANAPDIAYINLYRIEPMSGRQMRLKVKFRDVEDPTVGFAYTNALSDRHTRAETRTRLERKLWKICTDGVLRPQADGTERLDTDLLYSEAFYNAMKGQARAELTNHCLVRLGVVNRKLAGIPQDAYIPADILGSPAPENPAGPAPQSASSGSEPASAATEASSTPSATSPTSPAGTDDESSKYSFSGPPRRSKRPGSPGTPKT